MNSLRIPDADLVGNQLCSPEALRAKNDSVDALAQLH